MKTKQENFLMLILIVCLSAALIQAQPGSVEKISPDAARFDGATEVKFSPSGKLMIIQTDVGFYYFPTERLDQVIADFDGVRDSSWVEGQAKAFLPVSEKIVFSSRRGLHALDAQTGKTQPIFQMTADDEEKGNYLGDGEMVVVSENLIVSGDGEYDMGLRKGNILRFDVPLARVTRGAQINGFKNGWLSPSGKYVLYDHAGEAGSHTDLYNVALNANFPIPKRFNFKRHFPQYKETSVSPVGWVAADKFLATVVANQFEDEKKISQDDLEEAPLWLVLFDAARGKIIWKRQIEVIRVMFYFELSNQDEAFLETDNGRYELSLADGNLTRLDIKGNGFILSPNKTRMAFFDQTAKKVLVSSPDGADKKFVLELPEDWQGRWAMNELSVRSLTWSPDGKRLFVFDGTRLLIIKLEN